MTREFSLAHFTLLDRPPPELARVAARAGYDFIGLRLIPLDRPGEPRYPLAEDRQLRAETRRAQCAGRRSSDAGRPSAAGAGAAAASRKV